MLVLIEIGYATRLFISTLIGSLNYACLCIAFEYGQSMPNI